MGEGAVMMILMLVVLVILFAGGLYVKKMLVVTDPNTDTGVDSEDASTAQEFLPFVDIDGTMIDLGNHRYRAIIECTSVNYNLKTEAERDVIELSFQKFISSLSFPITFHIQTRVVDNTVVVRELEKDVERLKVENPAVYEYAKTYLESMRNFDVYIGTVKQKKKYIIVGYEDAYVLGELSDPEKRELSRQQLKDRVSFIVNQLSSLQIKAKCLDEEGLIDLLYNSYHREDAQYDISEMLGMGGYTTISVSGENKLSKLSVEEKIDLELVRVQNMIKEEYLDSKLGYDEDIYREVSAIYNKLKGIRDALGSPYETNYSIDVWDNKQSVKERECNKKYSESREESYAEPKVEISKESIVNDLRETYEKNDWNVNFENNVTSKKDDVLSFKEEKTDNDWSLDFTSDLDDKKSDVLSFEEEKTDDDWSLDFTSDLDDKKSDVLSFEEEKADDDWSLDFTSDLDDKKSDVLSFEEEKADDDWSLDFTSDLDDKKSDVLSFEEEKADDDWSLDFTSDLDDKKSDVLSFEEEKTDNDWSLDFTSDLDSKDDDLLDFKKNKTGKHNRLTMFD